LQNSLWCREGVVAKKRDEPPENCSRGFAAELLVNNSTGQSLERRQALRAYFSLSDTVDQARHRRVGSQMLDRPFVHGEHTRLFGRRTQAAHHLSAVEGGLGYNHLHPVTSTFNWLHAKAVVSAPLWWEKVRIT
jgi:hypothetical protein